MTGLMNKGPHDVLFIPQAAEEDAAPAKKEKSHFTVKLTELKAEDKVKLIKEVKNCIQGLNLVQVRERTRETGRERGQGTEKE